MAAGRPLVRAGGSFVASLLAGTAVCVRRGGRPGWVAGTGLVLFAGEPFTVLSGGYEVASRGAAFSGLPGVVPAGEGLVVIVTTPSGACSAYLDAQVLLQGSFLVGLGHWRSSLPERARDGWTATRDRFWSARRA